MLQKDIEKLCLSEVKPMILTEEDILNFEESTKCSICEKDFNDSDKKV